jgi:hypothetical protein
MVWASLALCYMPRLLCVFHEIFKPDYVISPREKTILYPCSSGVSPGLFEPAPLGEQFHGCRSTVYLFSLNKGLYRGAFSRSPFYSTYQPAWRKGPSGSSVTPFITSLRSLFFSRVISIRPTFIFASDAFAITFLGSSCFFLFGVAIRAFKNSPVPSLASKRPTLADPPFPCEIPS